MILVILYTGCFIGDPMIIIVIYPRIRNIVIENGITKLCKITLLMYITVLLFRNLLLKLNQIVSVIRMIMNCIKSN